MRKQTFKDSKFNFAKSARIGAGVLLIVVSTSAIGYSLYTRYTSHHKMDSVQESVEDTLVAGSDITHDMDTKDVSEGVAILEAPKIQLKAPICDGVDKDTLSYAVGHFPNTPDYGSVGNCCVAGHRSAIYNCILNDVDNLEIGDSIFISKKTGEKFEYTLYDKKVVIPNNTSVLENTKDTRLTIVTCTNWGKERLILTAKILTDEEKVNLKSIANREKSNNVISHLVDFSSKLNSVQSLLDESTSTKSIKRTVTPILGAASSKTLAGSFDSYKRNEVMCKSFEEMK